MKVKELIRELYRCNIENDVFIIADESGSFSIEGVVEEGNVVYIVGD